MVDKPERIQARSTKMVSTPKLIMYKGSLGQLDLFSLERRKPRAGRSSCCFLLTDKRKIGKMQSAPSERWTAKGQAATIVKPDRG